MVDPDSGKIIKKFDSISEADAFLGRRPGNMYIALNTLTKSGKRRKHEGYYWK